MTTLTRLRELLADPEAGLELAVAAVNALPALLRVAEAAKGTLEVFGDRASSALQIKANEHYQLAKLRAALAALEGGTHE
jgi:hypothetical protein